MAAVAAEPYCAWASAAASRLPEWGVAGNTGQRPEPQGMHVTLRAVAIIHASPI